jgi:hypothetical protein
MELKTTRRLGEIRSVEELREMRREMELREFFARERLTKDAAETFSLANLISFVAPQGSVVDRIIGGVGTGFSAIQGVLGIVGSLLDGRPSRNKPAE